MYNSLQDRNAAFTWLRKNADYNGRSAQIIWDEINYLRAENEALRKDSDRLRYEHSQTASQHFHLDGRVRHEEEAEGLFRKGHHGNPTPDATIKASDVHKSPFHGPWPGQGSVEDQSARPDPKIRKVPADKPVGVSTRQEGGDHYLQMGIQPWDAMEAWMTPQQFRGFLLGNAIKYLARCETKGKLEDLRKARHYLDKLIENLEGTS